MKLKKIEESLLFDELKDPEFTAGYLQAILKEGSCKDFFIAVGNVAKANGGIGKVAKSTNFGRESLYKTFSKSGNPYFSTIYKVIKSLGLQLSVTIDNRKSNRKVA